LSRSTPDASGDRAAEREVTAGHRRRPQVPDRHDPELFNREIVELEPVESIMTTQVSTVRKSTHVSELVPRMTDRGYRHLPVVDDSDRLVGMVTRGELIAVLNRALLGEDLSG
jgi:CBS-domain-containing membrane protein